MKIKVFSYTEISPDRKRWMFAVFPTIGLKKDEFWDDEFSLHIWFVWLFFNLGIRLIIHRKLKF